MNRRGVDVAPRARSDLDELVAWYTLEAGQDIADRFVTAAMASFSALAENQGMGSPVRSAEPRLSSLRKWRVQGFPRILIFYEPGASVVTIVRVLHASQDWWDLLEVGGTR